MSSVLFSLKHILLLILPAILILWHVIPGYHATLSVQSISGKTMGTRYQVLFYPGRTNTSPDNLKVHIEQVLFELNRQMSHWQPASEISRFNRLSDTQWFTVSEDFYSVVKMAQTISRMTQGSFDITIAPLVNAWGFGPEQSDQPLTAVPDDKTLEVLKSTVNYKSLEIHPEKTQIRKLKPLSIDLSAIAKGYAVDQLAALLEQYQIENYLVEIGGEIKSKGKKPHSHWKIAIETPQPAVRQAFQAIHMPLLGCAAATSGNYRNFYTLANQTYAHTINPSTARPTDNSLMSVTVFHRFTAVADALATAFMVMGPEKSLAFAQSLQLTVFLIAAQDDELSITHFPEKFEPGLTSCRNSGLFLQ